MECTAAPAGSDGAPVRPQGPASVLWLPACEEHSATVEPPFGEHRYIFEVSGFPTRQRIIVENATSETVGLNLRRSDQIDTGSVRTLLGSILSDDMGPEQKAIAILQFLSRHAYHWYPATEGESAHDPLQFINVYGYGFCDDFAKNQVNLARLAGLDGRVWFLEGHVVSEIEWGGEWHMVDPDHRVFYRLPSGKIASVADLARDPSLMTGEPVDPTGYESEKMAEMYASRDDNVPYYEDYPQTPTFNPRLKPGDRVTFDTKGDSAMDSHCGGTPGPPVVGVGTLERDLSSHIATDDPTTLQFEVEWPYTFLRARVDAVLADQPSELIWVGTSSDGEYWVSNTFSLDGLTLTVPLEFTCRGRAFQSFHLRVRAAAPVESAHLTLTFQFSPRAAAALVRGKNELIVVAQPEVSGYSANERLKVPHEWTQPR